jgi:hypothetical protein
MDYPEKVKQAFANKTDDLGVIAAADTEVPPVEHGDRWGNWEFDAERLVLVYSQEGRRERYEIDLESMTTSAEMLDLIFQMHIKTWIDRKDIGDLVQALDDLFHPETTLCSGGASKQLDATKFLRANIASAA